MSAIEYQRIGPQNFSTDSLDSFDRTQQVTRQWRKVEGTWQLVERPFTDNWSAEKKREVAAELLEASQRGEIAHAAFSGGQVVGFIYVSPARFGSQGQYVELDNMQVSRAWRGQGIGRQLFKLACADARLLSIPKLYISAQPSGETVGFYRTLGCVNVQEINPVISEREPFDVPLEYAL